MQTIDTKRVIIVGATSGIGRELAILMAKDGWKVGITGRRIEKLLELQATAPDQFIVQNWDAATCENERELDTLVEKLGGLDMLVMNSGVAIVNRKLAWDAQKTTIDLNVSAFVQITSWAMLYFENQKRGHIVGISSIASQIGSRQAPSYSASKAFVSNFMEGIRARAGRRRMPIYVTDIRPGFVETEMTDGQKGMFWVAPINKAGRQIYSAIKRKKSVAYITKRWSLIALIFKFVPRSFIKYF